MSKKTDIYYIDSYLRNYENVGPQEVVDYYTNLGDWQDLLTKTDYTYSPASVYYRKKINGIYPVIPNMSRLSLWKYEFDDTVELTDNWINTEVEKNSMHLSPSQKWTFRDKRYSISQSATRTNFLLLILFIFFVFFSLKKVSFSYF